MTTYTSIANGAVDAGSPIDEALVTALRDNPLAIQEGDASAPAVADTALAPNQGTPAAGDVAIASGTGFVLDVTTSTTQWAVEFTVNVAGTYRVRANFYILQTAGTAESYHGVIRQNTTDRATVGISSSNATPTNWDGALSAGDVIRIGCDVNAGSATSNNILVTGSVCCDSVGFIVDRVSAGTGYVA